MNRIADIVSKVLSVLFYPLFIPTYGVALFCYAFSAAVAPLSVVWIAIAIAGTLLLTCLLPISAIWIMVRKGDVKDMQIENPKERTMPYLYAALGFAFWSYLMIAILHAPIYIQFIACGATAAIGLITIINRWWKISAHLTGIGGLLGGMICYYLGLGILPGWGILCFGVCLTLMLMYARLYLNAHTPLQVIAGWLMGMSCTCLPYCIYCYVQ
jgi:membrane-associated phospholipid phosphatase